MTSMTYQVTGMTCEHCVRAVTSELAGVPGVSAVTVALVPGGESAVTVDQRRPARGGRGRGRPRRGRRVLPGGRRGDV